MLPVLPQIVVAIVIYVSVAALPQPLQECKVTADKAQLHEVQRQCLRQRHDMLLLRSVSADAVTDKVLLVIFPHEVNLIRVIIFGNDKVIEAGDFIFFPVLHDPEELGFLLRNITALHRLKDGRVLPGQSVFFSLHEMQCFVMHDARPAGLSCTVMIS